MDFQRYDHKPGWLYLARNDEYRPGLFKMGLSENPDLRTEFLNRSSDAAFDIGQVRLLHQVAVPAMGVAEKTLFAACAPRRISLAAEYFLGSEAVFQCALDAVAAYAKGNLTALERFLASSPFAWLDSMPASFWGMPRTQHLVPGPAVYLLRNPWHAEGVYRYACTTLPGAELLRVMESRQRRDNGVFGFYRAVAVFPTADPNAAKNLLREAARPWVFSPRFSFVRGECADIEAMLRNALARLAPYPVSESDDMVAEAVKHIKKSEAPWNPPCPTCGQILRFRRATIGARQTLRCPSCAELMQVHIGAAYATTTLPN